MRRRGPPEFKKRAFLKAQNRTVNSKHRVQPQNGEDLNISPDDLSRHHNAQHHHRADTDSSLHQLVRYSQVSAYPRVFDATESLLLQNYVQRFSRVYPTCSGPGNPFLSILLPLAMRNDVVLDSLLALSGAQRWNDNWAPMEKESLKLRQRALRGCRELLVNDHFGSSSQKPDSTHHRSAVPARVGATSRQNLLFLLTSSVLFLLYEKVSGEPTWKPHIEFIAQFFERSMNLLSIDPETSPRATEAIRFLHDIFVYNDLVRSTSTQTAPLSKFYLSAIRPNGSECFMSKLLSPATNSQAPSRSRYYFPNLIARLSSGDETVSESDIDAWDGSMSWLPSFALDKSRGDEKNSSSRLRSGTGIANDCEVTSELYQVSLRIYRLQVLGRRWINQPRPAVDDKGGDSEVLQQLAGYAHSLMDLLQEGSVYENALLWPIGIFAKQLTLNQPTERESVIRRLKSLEGRFQMRHFKKVQNVLLRHWAIRDGMPWPDSDQDIAAEGVILLG